MRVSGRNGSNQICTFGNADVEQKRTQEEFEDTKGVIRIRLSKKDRQHNGQKKKDKQPSTKHNA